MNLIAIGAADPELVVEFCWGVLGWQVVEQDAEVGRIAPAGRSGPTIDAVKVPESE